MVKYTLKRVGLALLTLFLIVFLLFVLVRIMPGNPFPSERMSAEAIAAKRAEMGLDDPILIQFGRYLSNLLRGDFGKGTSLYNGAPIKTVLSTAISNSFRIGGIAILIGTAVGLLLGIVAALNGLSGTARRRGGRDPGDLLPAAVPRPRLCGRKSPEAVAASGGGQSMPEPAAGLLAETGNAAGGHDPRRPTGGAGASEYRHGPAGSV